MLQAHILIQAEVGRAGRVAREVGAIRGVLSAEDVTGPYDVVARAEARDLDDLSERVLAQIQAVDGLTRTSPIPSSTCKRQATDGATAPRPFRPLAPR